mmetsp:Transcript_101613/g.287944  ORF Transcript_101613/g.287944 Transcript_101613/m.287944 type:complete len:153 (-) Transcript_101613:78-536(-)
MGRDSRSPSSSSGSDRGGAAARKPKETGTINSWNNDKQFGFISCDGNRPDVFFHAEGVRDTDVRDMVKTKGLKRGDRIMFDVREPEGSRKKLEAMNVELVDEGRSRGGGSGGAGRKRSRSRSRSRGRSGSRSQSRSRGRSRRRRSTRSRSRR